MKNIALILLIVFIVAVAIIIALERPTIDNSPDKKSNTTNNFSLPDYNGTKVSLDDFDGKVRVVNSWATWCPFCVTELPHFVELQEEFDNEIVVIAINRRESLTTARDFTDSLEISEDLIFLLDSNDSFYQSIGGFSMPETLFINADGEITFHKHGFMTLNEMQQHIKDILHK